MIYIVCILHRYDWHRLRDYVDFQVLFVLYYRIILIICMYNVADLGNTFETKEDFFFLRFRKGLQLIAEIMS